MVLDKLVEKDNLVFCTDSNVHHPAWDPLRKADAAGKRLYDWLHKNDLQAFNDGAVTRVSGSLRSTPDVTFGRTAVPTQLRPHQRQRRQRSKLWYVPNGADDEPHTIGSSDHLPIGLDIPLHRPPVSERRRPRWAFKKRTGLPGRRRQRMPFRTSRATHGSVPTEWLQYSETSCTRRR